MITAGIDIGSITAKAAIFENGKILATKVIFTGYNAEAAGLKVYEECFLNAVWHYIKCHRKNCFHRIRPQQRKICR